MKVIFKIEDEIKEIEKNGIKSNDKYSNRNLNILMHYYMHMANFDKYEAIEKTKNIAKDYFKLMPDGEAESTLSAIADSPICGVIKSAMIYNNPVIDIFESEWKVIMGIADPVEQLLCFVTLVVCKFVGRIKNDDGKIIYYPYISMKEKDIFDILDVKKKDLHGRSRNELWNSLSTKGLVKFKADYSQQFPRILVGCPFNVSPIDDKNEEKVIFSVNDFSDFKIYIDAYGKDKKKSKNRDIKTCKQCGRLFHAGQKRYCPECAELRKRGKVA